MRFLFVTHRYPPDGTAGVETYVETVARALAERGHDVHVLTAVKDIARRDLSVHRRARHGVAVVEVVNNMFAEAFEETWSNPRIDELAAAVLDEVAPDVVHVHHLMYLSLGLLDACRERGIPVAVTLHDFWLGCARFGQLLHADGTRCERVDPERCATCLPSFTWRQSDAARRLAKAVAAVKSLAAVDLSGPLSRIHRQRQSAVSASAASPSGPEAEAFREAVPRRVAALVGAVNRCASVVLLPAAFQRRWFEELGVEPGRLRVLPTGLDWEGMGRSPAPAPEPGGDAIPRPSVTRFLFLGSLVPHKGAHVLLEAWERLDPALRSRARLALHGPSDTNPAYVTRLRQRAEGLGLGLGPRLDRDGVRDALAQADVLVVPSLWLEVRPLVMIEAYAAGLRVLASDLGGMAEVLEQGVPGQAFAPGDADALAAALRSEIERVPGPPAGLPGPSAAFPTWGTVVAELVRLSEALRTA